MPQQDIEAFLVLNFTECTKISTIKSLLSTLYPLDIDGLLCSENFLVAFHTSPTALALASGLSWTNRSLSYY